MKSCSMGPLGMRRWLALALAGWLSLPPAATPQTPLAAPQPAAPAPGQSIQSLRVVPLAGNQESNDLERRVMAPLVVQVLDQNSRPVEGADVVFTFPTTGP